MVAIAKSAAAYDLAERAATQLDELQTPHDRGFLRKILSGLKPGNPHDDASRVRRFSRLKTGANIAAMARAQGKLAIALEKMVKIAHDCEPYMGKTHAAFDFRAYFTANRDFANRRKWP